MKIIMKRIISLLIVFILYLNLNAQNSVIRYFQIDTVEWIRTNDTIPVIMIVSDTSKPYVVSPSIKFQEDSEFDSIIYDTIYFDYNNTTVWIFGFEVSELHRNNYWIHTKYLDINKEPLSSNIIVWDSKKRKGNDNGERP